MQIHCSSVAMSNLESRFDMGLGEARAVHRQTAVAELGLFSSFWDIGHKSVKPGKLKY